MQSHSAIPGTKGSTSWHTTAPFLASSGARAWGAPDCKRQPPPAPDIGRVPRPSAAFGSRAPGAWLTRLVHFPPGAGGVEMPGPELPEVSAGRCERERMPHAQAALELLQRPGFPVQLPAGQNLPSLRASAHLPQCSGAPTSSSALCFRNQSTAYAWPRSLSRCLSIPRVVSISSRPLVAPHWFGFV